MTSNTTSIGSGPYVPPRWTIDLSLPPNDRYRALARHYRDDVQGLTSLFDELLSDLTIPEKWIPTVNRLSRFILRKLNDKSQTQEIQGISEESGIPMYLLVAFNVVLDVLMGCTSGGVRSLEKGQPLSGSKMLHFRTLDWAMDPLRKIIVQLDFIRSKSTEPDRIIASSITYVGFTGVLTGVRCGLSLSLNFRAMHDNSTKMAQFRFYFHHLLVLLGRRPSIATYLRKYLTGDHESLEASLRLGRSKKEDAKLIAQIDRPCDLLTIFEDIRTYHTTAAYLIFSDGDSTMSVDKDFRTAKMRTSRDFIATTNHDVLEHEGEQKPNKVATTIGENAVQRPAFLEEFLEESEERFNCISNRWKKLVARKQKERARRGDRATMEEVASETTLTQKQVIEWVSKYPTSNETTHFGAVLDPKVGTVIWCMAYPEALGEEDR